MFGLRAVFCFAVQAAVGMRGLFFSGTDGHLDRRQDEGVYFSAVWTPV